MRVISGTKKGLRLNSIKDRAVRPTADSTKELMFNVVSGHVADSMVLDVYAGTGSLGIEALSRGAAKAIFVENSRSVQNVLFANLEKTGFENMVEVIGLSAERALQKLANLALKFDLIFADPPYGDERAKDTVRLIEKYGLLAKDGWLIMEHSIRNVLESTGQFVLKSQKKQGDTGISFYQYV